MNIPTKPLKKSITVANVEEERLNSTLPKGSSMQQIVLNNRFFYNDNEHND